MTAKSPPDVTDLPEPGADAAADGDELAARAVAVIRAATGHAARVAPRPADPDNETPAQAPRLLVVDDAEAVGRALARIARGLGWAADVATCWSQAQALLRRTRYDCLLVDYGLGGLTGAEAVRWARELCPGLPAALMSGNESAAQPAAEAGCPLLLKPFGRDALAALLTAASKSAGAAEGAAPGCGKEPRA